MRAAVVFLFAVAFASVCHAEAVGQIWVDRSPSPDGVAIAAGLDSALAMLPQIARETNVTEIEVYGFAGDAFDASPVGRPLRLLPFAPPDCIARQQKSDRGTIFKTAGEDRACTSKTDQARKRYERAQADEIRRSRTEVMAHVPAGRGRTCLIDLLARFAIPGARPVRFALIITDGVETCDAAAKEILPAPHLGTDVVMVLISAKTEDSRITPRQRFLKLKRTWEQRAPWLKAVVPRSGLSMALFGQETPTAQILK